MGVAAGLKVSQEAISLAHLVPCRAEEGSLSQGLEALPLWPLLVQGSPAAWLSGHAGQGEDARRHGLSTTGGM